jgi:uncharacterized membrane protein YkvA (DUF1232 family)
MYSKSIPVLFSFLSLIAAVFYYIMPLDFWPDFLPLGKLDDPVIPIIVVFLPGVYLFIRSCQREIVLEYVDAIDRKRKGRRSFFRF